MGIFSLLGSSCSPSWFHWIQPVFSSSSLICSFLHLRLVGFRWQGWRRRLVFLWRVPPVDISWAGWLLRLTDWYSPFLPRRWRCGVAASLGSGGVRMAFSCWFCFFLCCSCLSLQVIGDGALLLGGGWCFGRRVVFGGGRLLVLFLVAGGVRRRWWVGGVVFSLVVVCPPDPGCGGRLLS